MIDTVFDSMGMLPECKISKKLFKKQFQDNFELGSSEKQVLSTHIESITLEYLLNKNTINISPYTDEDKEYSEIAFVRVQITNANKLKAINNIIQLIPYPLVVFYELENSFCINISPKRINKNDKTKLVVIEQHFTEWLKMDSLTAIEKEFLDSLNIKNHPFTDFFAFYESLLEKVLAFNASKYSGTLKVADDTKETLETIRNIETELNELKSKIKKEKSLKDRVTLNIEMKKLMDKLENAKSSLL